MYKLLPGVTPGSLRDQFSWEAQRSARVELRNQDFFFLAEQGGKARELSGDGRTVGLSSRLYEGQEENQRIPTERET